MNRLTNILRFFRVLMPVLFILYMGNILFCSHTHVINGVVIVHSHPFANGEHTHTTAELETILYLSHFLSTGDTGLWTVLPFIPIVFCTLYASVPSRTGRQRYESDTLLRAPPASLF